MNDSSNVTNLPTAKLPEPKLRTITLTNRAPIQIVEDDWPIIAQGTCGEDWYDGNSGWSIELRVRQDKYGRFIIHGKYNLTDDMREDNYQTVRVGRYINTVGEYARAKLWDEILAVGEEMRSRILNERLKNHVVYATDAVFASLKPQAN